MSILIVDDEQDILDELEDALVFEGYQVAKAESVRRAIDLLTHDSDIKLVITDLRMPGESGNELLKYLSFFHKYKVIVVSGHSSHAEDNNIIDVHQIPFFMKPVDLDKLMNKVAEMY